MDILHHFETGIDVFLVLKHTNIGFFDEQLCIRISFLEFYTQTWSKYNAFIWRIFTLGNQSKSFIHTEKLLVLMNGSLDKYTFILYICIKLRNTPANTSYGSTITAVFFRITNKIADRYVS